MYRIRPVARPKRRARRANARRLSLQRLIDGEQRPAILDSCIRSIETSCFRLSLRGSDKRTGCGQRFISVRTSVLGVVPRRDPEMFAGAARPVFRPLARCRKVADARVRCHLRAMSSPHPPALPTRPPRIAERSFQLPRVSTLEALRSRSRRHNDRGHLSNTNTSAPQSSFSTSSGSRSSGSPKPPPPCGMVEKTSPGLRLKLVFGGSTSFSPPISCQSAGISSTAAARHATARAIRTVDPAPG